MRKVIVIIGLIFAVLALGFIANKKYTKSFSPESVARYSNNGMDIKVFYCQPAVKKRLIFGPAETALVPFGQLWRTGANEATEIEFNKDLIIQGKKLKAGRYSLFTIPAENEWTIIFNKELDQWGAFTYNESEDVLRVPAVSNIGSDSQELFNIEFVSKETSQLDLVLSWDHTRVVLPMQY